MIPSLQRNAGRPARLLADGCLEPLRKGPARHDRIAARLEGGNDTAAKSIAPDLHAQFILLGQPVGAARLAAAMQRAQRLRAVWQRAAASRRRLPRRATPEHHRHFAIRSPTVTCSTTP